MVVLLGLFGLLVMAIGLAVARVAVSRPLVAPGISFVGPGVIPSGRSRLLRHLRRSPVRVLLVVVSVAITVTMTVATILKLAGMVFLVRVVIGRVGLLLLGRLLFRGRFVFLF